VVTIEAPALPDGPIASGADYFIWFGGRWSLDFVNTVRRRSRGGVELLVTPEDLAAWLVAAGVVAEPPEVDRRLLAEAVGLRAAMTEAFERALLGEAPGPGPMATLNHWLGELPAPALRAELHDGSIRLVERPRPDAAPPALAQVALDAARALGEEERRRLRVCASERCAVLFFDRSPAGDRRWCSMKACGNRAKVSAHRERQRRRSG
jgi:predicted RNA-binding Zn ribbon-like protein